ncbi:MAG: hypothetical protein ABI678_15570 [Kofleriaceae bacterium]
MIRLAALALAAGCLGPQVSDAVPATDILPANAPVPSVEDDPVLAGQLAEYDGVADTIPRETAFASGGVIHTWDFGPAPAFAAPLFILVAPDGDGVLSRIPIHPTVIEAMPGDPGYSPYWAAFFVQITDRYHGEQLTSSAAIADAVTEGLVLPPVAQSFAINCPATASTTRLQVAPTLWLAPPAHFFYRGMTVPYYDFGPMPLIGGVMVGERARFRLHRQGEDVLDEIDRGVDITGDGDLGDTNDIYAGQGDPLALTPHARTIDVTIVSSVAAIDSYNDETLSDVKTESALFTPAPTSLVVAVHPSDELHDRPLQRTAGGL